jgi:hypothetical protein
MHCLEISRVFATDESAAFMTFCAARGRAARRDRSTHFVSQKK